jgi:hypothetical protein
VEEAAQPFALPDGPLFRCRIVLMGAADSAAVIFTGHHVICDGWSMDVLLHDLCAIYSEEISGESAGLGPAPSFADYVTEQGRREVSAEFAEAKEYWKRKFAEGFPALLLPTDFPSNRRRQYRARRLERSIGASLVDDLRALGVRHNCTFFSVFLAALTILLARVSRQRRFVLSLPMAEQPVVGQPELVGNCVSLLPFMVDLQIEESVSAYLVRLRRELGNAQAQSSFTLVHLLENLRLATPAPGISPVSAGLTSVKKLRAHELPQQGFSVDYYANPKSYESLECYLNATETEDGLTLYCHYDTGLLKNATVEGWLSELEAILANMAANPGREALELARLKHAGTISEEVLFIESPSSPAL